MLINIPYRAYFDFSIDVLGISSKADFARGSAYAIFVNVFSFRFLLSVIWNDV